VVALADVGTGYRSETSGHGDLSVPRARPVSLRAARAQATTSRLMPSNGGA
jgi:hypothetical protein